MTSLPFYPDWMIEPCSLGTGKALRRNDRVLVLDWTNRPFFELNQQGAIYLTRRTLAPYVKFFVDHVRGDLGCYRIVEPDDTIPWLPNASADHRAKVRNQVCPARFLGIDDEGLYRLDTTVIFSRYTAAALFRADIRVAFVPCPVFDPHLERVEKVCAGQLQLCEGEELLLVDLQIEQPPRPAHRSADDTDGLIDDIPV